MLKGQIRHRIQITIATKRFIRWMEAVEKYEFDGYRELIICGVESYIKQLESGSEVLKYEHLQEYLYPEEKERGSCSIRSF